MPPFDLAEARRRAAVMLGNFADGIDIVSRRRQRLLAQQEALQARSVREVINLFYAEQNTGNRYWKELKATFNNQAWGIANTSIRDVKKQDVKSLLSSIRKPGPKRATF